MDNRTYYPTGQRYIVEQRVDGIRKGAVYVYDVAGQKINTIEYINGQIYYIAYLQNSLRHNLYGPACIEWSNGKINHISYWQNDKIHNLYGPAIMSWFNVQIYSISYWQNGRYHNLHGPAHMYWYDGKIKNIEYYHFGNLIKKYNY